MVTIVYEVRYIYANNDKFQTYFTNKPYVI